MRKSDIAIAVSLATLLGWHATVQADYSKPTDANGGHWDSAGNYHCHLDGCVPTVNRYQYRSRAFSARDMDQYFLDEDWPHWLAPQGGCKDMRTIVLESTSRVPVTWTNPRQCEIREGLWIDEYTGEEFTRAAALEVDHIIPPRYANGSNGYQWDDGKRAQFANDAYNLIPVGRETARQKRDRGIGDWRPPRTEFQCDYAQAWQGVSKKYGLDLLAKDASRMNKILASCDLDAGRDIKDTAK